ncbi:MAG TPA: muconolactone Delta-isomerase family protein [Acidimicrobiia bacterium]
MEFLVTFALDIPAGTPDSEVNDRENAEAAATATLSDEGNLLRVWRSGAPGESTVIGLYRAESQAQLLGLLGALPLADWMHVDITPLEPHPNDHAARMPSVGNQLPYPRLSLAYRLDATLDEPLDFGERARRRRRIVSLTGGTFTGPKLNGTLLTGASADWQVVLGDGTALGDVRYTLQTDRGDLLYVQSRSVRHGPAGVLARLGRGEDVDPDAYTFRAATQIETAAPDLDWLNKGVFVSVGGRRSGYVTYETYLVA